MKNRLTKLLLLPLFVSALSGCDVFGLNSDSNYEIELAKYIEDAYVDEMYDITKCFKTEEGYEYSAEVYSYDVQTLEETKLNVVNMKFVPQTTNDLAIVLNAKKKNFSCKKTINISVGEHGDPIEDLLIDSGYSGFCDLGYRKTLNRNELYKRPCENNKTSIACNFTGNSLYPFGGAIICPNNFRCLDCWTDKEWTNSIFKFWCYNDSDYGIEFGFRITSAEDGVDIDMGHEVLDEGHIAAPHAWTEIKLALKPLGITHPVYTSEDGTHNDSFNVKTRYLGIDRNATDLPEYKYNFYLDDIDVVPASNYPEIETSDYNDGWEYMIRDTHWEKGTIVSDFNNVCTESNPSSTSSKKITFENSNFVDPDMVLAPEMQFVDNLPDFTKGVFKFDVKYSPNITDRSIKLKFIAHETKTSSEWVDMFLNVNPEAIGDGWYHVNLDLSTAGIPYDEVIRIGFTFNGVNSGNKSSAFVYIDNIFLVQE